MQAQTFLSELRGLLRVLGAHSYRRHVLGCVELYCRVLHLRRSTHTVRYLPAKYHTIRWMHGAPAGLR